MKQIVWRLLFVPALLLVAVSCQRSIRAGLGLDALFGVQDTTRHPSVKLDTLVAAPFKVLSVQFEVYTDREIGQRLNAGYVLLCNYINDRRLVTKRVMAFYYTYDEPYLVEAAIEVDSLPVVLDSIITARTIRGGKLLIAHYKGPYEQMVMAYRAIDRWLADHHKVASELPFEVYLNDLMTVKSRFDLLTDVYQFYQ
ncbi:GyrI-like domain-containing protein [Paraflavitalea pollutisoli]|uniref:GyrI-like domain-containing protein n=1 Tax=Paraflavitalea pollutisoli TaxID=3034143 RepID=UPI0023ED6EC0|nr:GyrI-like domain-containing protein [Paraflavitalea sp. H1-2-19X]